MRVAETSSMGCESTNRQPRSHWDRRSGSSTRLNPGSGTTAVPGLTTATMWQRSANARNRCQVAKVSSPSLPSIQAMGSPLPSDSIVSMEYDGPSRRSSASEAASAASPETARRNISHRSRAFARAARCGGWAERTSVTDGTPRAFFTERAAWRWPTCTGSKVPPRNARNFNDGELLRMGRAHPSHG